MLMCTLEGEFDPSHILKVNLDMYPEGKSMTYQFLLASVVHF